MTPTPIITVTISRSAAASGTYAVSVLEHVDRRFNAVFEAADSVELPESVTVPLFGGNVFGRAQTWLKPAISPGDLQAYVKKTSRAVRGGPRTISGGSVGPPAVTFKLSWSRLYTSVFSKPSGIVIRGPGGNTAIFGYESVDAFVLEGTGVTVCLYRFHRGRSGGRARCPIRPRREHALYAGGRDARAPADRGVGQRRCAGGRYGGMAPPLKDAVPLDVERSRHLPDVVDVERERATTAPGTAMVVNTPPSIKNRVPLPSLKSSKRTGTSRKR